MQCNYNSFIQIINFHGLFRNALRCQKTGACRILVPLRYFRSFLYVASSSIIDVIDESVKRFYGAIYWTSYDNCLYAFT